MDQETIEKYVQSYREQLEKYASQNNAVSGIRVVDENREGSFTITVIGRPDISYIDASVQSAIRSMYLHLTRKEMNRARVLGEDVNLAKVNKAMYESELKTQTMDSLPRNQDDN